MHILWRPVLLSDLQYWYAAGWHYYASGYANAACTCRQCDLLCHNLLHSMYAITITATE